MTSASFVRWLVVAVGLAVAASCGNTVADEPTVIHDALVTLIEQAEVPARAIGPIADVAVREGEIVGKDALLAKIDDAEAQLAADRAEIELAVARREAKNDLPILAATKAAEAARAELKRATESAAKYEKSISQSELDRLRLTADEADYKQRQAVHVRETADLTARIKENELATIRHRLQLHQIKSPIAGVVVEVKRRRGEWVEPGALGRSFDASRSPSCRGFLPRQGTVEGGRRRSDSTSDARDGRQLKRVLGTHHLRQSRGQSGQRPGPHLGGSGERRRRAASRDERVFDPRAE